MNELTGPKGTRDFAPGEMEVRKKVIKIIEEVFEKANFKKWEGPAIEHFEILTKKSGPEIEKEIYTFKDKAGRKLGLRFDLTTQLSRIIASHPELKKPIKAYSYGKVWRYENPQQGRYREFMQMDIDIFGSESMLCEVELLSIVNQALNKLGLTNFTIFLNNRKVLQGILEELGLKNDEVVQVIRILDKLNKIGEEGVKKELQENNFDEMLFTKIKKILPLNEKDNLKKLKILEEKTKNQLALEGINELKEILDLSSGLDFYDKIAIDLTLARGFDYYTGPIFEVRLNNYQEVGSINGGGRYDNLVELLSGIKTPAVGISFGIERIIDIIDKNPELKNKLLGDELKVLVCYFNENQIKEGFKVVNQLRKEGIICELDLMKRSLKKQLKYANEQNFSKAIFIEEGNKISLKDLKTGEQKQITLSDAIKELKSEL